MQTFHYLPPTIEEQRAFVVQLLGTILGVAVVLFLSWKTPDGQLKAVLWGATIAIVFLLGRAAWQLELKARRAQRGEISLGDDGLHLTNLHGHEQIVEWQSIESCEVQGGKLRVTWPQNRWEVSAREVEDGLTMVRNVIESWQRATGQQNPPTNFIPLLPK
jgi:hypothetical protein